MIYCPNPDCSQRQHTDEAMACPTCGTNLVINGRYRAIESLKRLSAPDRNRAEVFIVQDLLSTTKVMKILRVGDPKLLELFDREAEALCELQHPGIPRIEDNNYFTFRTNVGLELKCLVMEKVDGINLKQWLEENHRCPPNLALQWLKQLVDILEHLHQHQWFHRDIKPTNIILKPDGKLVTIDFGAAKRITTNNEGEENLTAVFTIGYAPPEQLNRQAVPQSDFYALGRTFVHLLTGQSPLNFPVDRDRLQWRDPELQHFPKLVADLVDRLMTTVDERPRSADLIRQEIKHIERNKSRLRQIIYSKSWIFTILIAVPFLMFKRSDIRPVSPFITYGEKTFLPRELTPEKQTGMNAFAQGNYPKAIKDFQASLEKKPQDPETQIFLHNARIGHQASHTLAINILAPADMTADRSYVLRGVATMLSSVEKMTDASVKIAIVGQNDINTAYLAARDLVKQPDVISVIGLTFRRSELAVNDTYCSSKIVNIAISSQSLGSQATRCPGYAFHLIANDRIEAQSIAQHMLQKMHRKKAAIFFLSGNLNSYSKQLEFKSTLINNGGQIAGEFDMKSKDFSPSESVQQALRNQAEVIVVFSNLNDSKRNQKNLNNFLQILRLNHHHLPVLAGSSAFEYKLLEMVKSSGGQGKGIIVNAPCCSEFSKSNHWQDIITQDAIEVFMTALKQKPTKNGIHQVLSDPKFKAQGESGKIIFSQEGDRIAPPEFVQVLPGSQSGFGYDFVPLR